MNQSHHGSKVSAGLWDRLAIVIDKNQEPKRATFYQLAPGKLEWQENLPQIKLKATEEFSRLMILKVLLMF